MQKAETNQIVRTEDIEKDTVFSVSVKTIEALDERAKSLTITTAKERDSGADILSSVKTLGKEVEQRRKYFVDPLNAAVKSMNAHFRPWTDRLEGIERIIKTKIGGFIRIQEEEARKERERVERENAKRMAAFEKKVDAGKTVAPPVLKTVEVQAEKKFETTSGAKIHTMKKRCFKVTDLATLPIEYHIADETKIRKVVQAGVSTIPGVQIWEEDVIVSGRS